MAWKAQQKADERGYTVIPERINFYAGYSDGYLDVPMWQGSERDYYPNAYSAGYWEGRADKNGA